MSAAKDARAATSSAGAEASPAKQGWGKRRRATLYPKSTSIRMTDAEWDAIEEVRKLVGKARGNGRPLSRVEAIRLMLADGAEKAREGAREGAAYAAMTDETVAALVETQEALRDAEKQTRMVGYALDRIEHRINSGEVTGLDVSELIETHMAQRRTLTRVAEMVHERLPWTRGQAEP